MASRSGSEGEVLETDLEKATTAQLSLHGTSVDRRSRSTGSLSNSSLSSSDAGDARRYRARSRSPRRSRDASAGTRRSPRGEKRRRPEAEEEEEETYRGRDEVDYRRHASDRRRPYGRYDRKRSSYVDLDRADVQQHALGYGRRSEWNGYRGHGGEGRPTSGRLRDLRWEGRADTDEKDGRGPRSERGTGDVGGSGSGHTSKKRDRRHHYRDQSVSEWGIPLSDARKAGEIAKTGDDHSQAQSRSSARAPLSSRRPERVDASGPNTAAAKQHDASVGDDINAAQAPAESAPVNDAALIEERRRRREAIKAKYKQQEPGFAHQALQSAIVSDKGVDTPREDENAATGDENGFVGSPSPAREAEEKTDGSEAAETLLCKEETDVVGQMLRQKATEEVDGPSAADYDPTVDMQEDRARQDLKALVADVSAAAYEESDYFQDDGGGSVNNAKTDMTNTQPDFDMFADGDDDDDDNMFAPVDSKRAGSPARAAGGPLSEAKELAMGLLDDWDDADGYYRVLVGELLAGRYQVQASIGKGMFSTVVRASDRQSDGLVAIKMVRSNETMKKAGRQEIAVLRRLAAADPEQKKHVIRLEGEFEHKGHLCMVFEHLSMNLREVVRKFGRAVGINVRAVRLYGQQLFVALLLLRRCNIVHGDVKPDNVLVNEGRTVLKLCDLGSATEAGDAAAASPYLVSRFYRAPEIILGVAHDQAVDVWAVACTLFELYTGKILYTGRNNNEMVAAMLACRGRFPAKLLRRGLFAGQHFDEQQLHFRSRERDLAGRETVRLLAQARVAGRDVRARLLLAAGPALPLAEARELGLFADLLERCLNVNAEKRCSAAEALRHPFLRRAG